LNNRFFIAAAWAVFMACSVTTAVLAEDMQRQITVAGEGSVATVPDMATINLGVTHQAKEAGAAMAATSQATTRMLQRLADMGIEPRDMQTSSLTLNPVWSNRASSAPGEAVISGFVANNSVLVRVHDLDRLGQIMDAVIGEGANSFNGLRFSIEEPAPLMTLARQKAVADAIARAQLFATAAGVTLGPVQSLTEQGGSRPMVMEMSAARSGNVPIAAGEVSVSASVVMVFAIGE